jgi:hypothetical protein
MRDTENNSGGANIMDSSVKKNSKIQSYKIRYMFQFAFDSLFILEHLVTSSNFTLIFPLVISKSLHLIISHW